MSFPRANPPTAAEAPYVVFMISTLGVQVAVLTIAVLTLGPEYSTGSVTIWMAVPFLLGGTALVRNDA